MNEVSNVKKRRGRWQRTGGVARLQGKRVEEEVSVDDVAFTAIGVGERRRGEAVLADEGSVDVVEDVGPDLTDIVHLVELRDGGVSQRVGRGGGRVWVGTNSSCVVDDVLAHDVVDNLFGLVLGPSEHKRVDSTNRPWR